MRMMARARCKRRTPEASVLDTQTSDRPPLAAVPRNENDEYDDHHKFSSNDLNFNDSCPIFITMKDYVKLSKVNNKNLWVLKHEIKPSETLINKINDDINRLISYEN